jgi:cell wall-associated NlpC family hydrolase
VISARLSTSRPQRRAHRLAVAGLTAIALAGSIAAAAPAQAAPAKGTGQGSTMTVSATAGVPSSATVVAKAFARTHPTLRLGSKGSAVRKVQSYVKASVTGRFSIATRHHVRVVQKWGHLRPTGVVNAATWHVAYHYFAKHRAARAARLSPRNIIHTARKYIGGRYVYAGTTPRGFDCSGFTMYVFHKLGVSLPHNAARQYSTVRHISRRQARPGDLIFFHHGSHVYHVGIWAGHDGLYHASHPGRRTGYEKLWTSAVWFGRAR